MKYEPRKYQEFITRRIIESPAAGAFVDMGLGKTVATLTAIDELMFDRMEINSVLVIAPKKVAESVWQQEAQKWDHLQHLKFSLVLGTESQRKKALREKADVFVINRENVAWLTAQLGGAWPFDMVVIDESSSFKNHAAVRFKALKKVRPLAKRIVCLTGTPVPNGLLDLWSQVYLLDQGERLEKTITAYRTKYFTKDPFVPYPKYELIKNKTEDADLVGEGYYERKIYDKISDICFSMKSQDFIELPERIDNVQWINLPSAVMQKYLQFEREQVLAMDEAVELTAISAGALAMKLAQFANGAVYYGDEKQYTVVHNEKVEALHENIESLNGKPVLIFYQFQHDVDRLTKALKEFKPVVLKKPEHIDAWNRKEIQVMIAHPASAGHGLNLQFGGNHVEWFGIPRSSEQYEQGFKRLHRSGQTSVVTNNRLLVHGTIDEDALEAMNGKISMQEAMMAAVKVRMAKYRK